MDSDVFDVHCIHRQVGSTGLVIFERDDILLRHKPQIEDHTLSDIDADFVAMLHDMRELDVRFGFISHHSTPPFDQRVGIASATLTRLLDDLLKASGALPDFWIDAACAFDLRHRQHPHSKSELDLILSLTGWREADLNKTVVVRKAEAPLVKPSKSGLMEIFYPGLNAVAPSDASRRATVGWLKTKIKHALDLE
ncbi:hypothetical protein B5K05_33660 [Rhizobium phaseoli]|uniref:hypothetical protein n=1 Tax=Rhizobium phaseoli TaxID=396 RepID=UPI000E0DB289|nr:hypothetical protein [Rhizobium phaseoli]RDJ00851.1 hypothetical protein B5K05_33660 [Rhizobium phaseoli]RDJ00978.1 hypothetical protein B5K04_30970 [Rhizobium phaseoli]